MAIIVYVLVAVLVELAVAIFVGKFIHGRYREELVSVPSELDPVPSVECAPARRAAKYASRSMQY